MGTANLCGGWHGFNAIVNASLEHLFPSWIKIDALDWIDLFLNTQTLRKSTCLQPWEIKSTDWLIYVNQPIWFELLNVTRLRKMSKLLECSYR